MKKIITFLLVLVMVFGISACGNNEGVSSEKYDLSDLVQIAYSDIDKVCDTEELAAEGGQVLSAMQENDDLLLSYVVDSSIEITEDALGEYDHLIITNLTWIDRFDSIDNLVSVNNDEISAALQELIAAHMKAWSVDESELPEGISLYKYTGEGLLAFPANIGYGASAIQTSNPLIILIKSPTETMEASSFLLPLTSSGNIIFSNSELLQNELDNSSISQYIDRIESVNLE